MSFSYSGDPGGSDLDEIRFYLGDTDSEDSYISDEEIDFILFKYQDHYTSALGFAALCAEMIAAKVARQVSVSADGVSVALGELQQRFNDLATSLRAQYTALYPNTSMDSIVLDPMDPTIEPLTFGIGYMDNAEAGLQDMGRVGNYPGLTW